jgi:hypothetical protein
MIKVRYRDPNELSPGLHAAAERIGRNTTVYLLSGLTAQERQAALRRLRLSARMGHCPPLPAAQLGLALFADRIRTSVGQTGAVFRSHPAGSTVPVMAVSAGVIVFLLFSTVSIHVLHPVSEPVPLPSSGPAPAVTAFAAPMPRSSQALAAGGLGQAGQADSVGGHQTQTKSGSSGSSTFIWPTISGTDSGAGDGAVAVTGSIALTSSSTDTDSASGTGTGSGTPGGGPPGRGGRSGGTGPRGGGPRGDNGSASGGGDGPDGFQSSRHDHGADSDAAPAPADSASPSPTASPTASPTITPSPDPSASSDGDPCLDVGPLGICLDI